jgi:membrane protease YdiL (CAAX protease family)
VRPTSITKLALLFYGALFGVALLWAAFSGRSMLYASVRDQVRGVDWLGDVGAGALAAGIVIALSWEVTRRSVWGRALAEALGQLLGPLSLRTCLLLAAVSGVAEEAFFRGSLQPRVGLVWASLLFGLAHFAPRRELLPWTLFSVAAGFLLGFLFEATGNLVAPIVAHVAINAVNLRLLAVHYAPRP